MNAAAFFGLLFFGGLCLFVIGVRAQFDGRFRERGKVQRLLRSIWIRDLDDPDSPQTIQNSISKLAISGIMLMVTSIFGMIFSWEWLNGLIRKMLIR